MSEAEPAGLGQGENQGGGRANADIATAQLRCSREEEPAVQLQPKSGSQGKGVAGPPF